MPPHVTPSSAAQAPVQKGLGAFYTPPALARQLVAAALAAHPGAPPALLALEPACGAGALLGALVERGVGQIVGVEVERDELEAARALVRGTPAADTLHLLHGDALRDTRLDERRAGFDLVVANPPWVSARTSARSHADRSDLRSRFATAAGASDLAACFVERAVELLRPGGVLSFLLPRALLTTRAGATLRRLLVEQTTPRLLQEVDGDRHFPGLGVYPVMLVATKGSPRRGDVMHLGAERSVPVGKLASYVDAGFPLGASSREVAGLDRRERCGARLEEVAKVFAMTAGFDASKTAELLEERAGIGGQSALQHQACGPPSASAGVPFVTSGNVRRWAVRRGRVRFQRRTYEDPVLVDRRGARAARDHPSKIVVAGMGKELRSVWFREPLAAGVGVYGVVPHEGVDPFLVLGCLNARSTTRDYSIRYPGKRMAGDYLAVNAHTLRALPIVPPEAEQAPDIARLARLLQGLHAGQEQGGHHQGGQARRVERAEAELDGLVQEALT